MFLRPKPGEDEEDILKQQEEFLKNKSLHGTVKVINKRKAETEKSAGDNSAVREEPTKRNRSKFSLGRNKEKSGERSAQEETPLVLGEVKERTVDGTFVPMVTADVPQEGFPQAFARDKTLKYQGRSIFSQQLSKENLSQYDCAVSVVDSSKQLSASKEIFGNKSVLVTGTEAEAIHEENLMKLSKMTKEEILQEQEKLTSQLDPKILQFLKSRRKGPGLSSSSRNIEHSLYSSDEKTDLKMDVDDSTGIISSLDGVQEESTVRLTVDNSNTDKTLQSVPLISNMANRWLHMDVVEIEKLKWMSEVPEPPPLPPDKTYAARFDFQGMLLPYVDEKLDVNKGLYHHGEEPARPGYSLQELFQLTRSSLLQQRVLSINTIANILEKTKSGYYDKCMEEPLLKVMLDSDVLLLLRFSLDDNTETLLTASLLALRNFLYNFPDEVCLDRVLGCYKGLEQPLIEVKLDVKPEKKEELKDEEKELKDYQIARVDLIKGALRTDIILRIRYILEILRPGPKSVIAALEILTRVARHSLAAVTAITSCPRLLALIIENFVPRDWRQLVTETKPQDMVSVYGVPLVQALKLLRVLACSSHTLAMELASVYGIQDVLISYISIDPSECGLPHAEALRLSLESFYLWQTLLCYNVAANTLVDLYPVLMRLVQFHYNCTSVSDNSSTFAHEHGAALFSLLEQGISTARRQKLSPNMKQFMVLPMEHFQNYVQPLEMCGVKWFSQLQQSETLTFSALKLVSSVLSCLANLYSNSSYLTTDLVSQLEHTEIFMQKAIIPFLKCNNFQKLTAKLRQCSCLLYTGAAGTKRDPEALPSLGGLLWGGEDVTPLLQPTSPFPLLQGLVSFLRAAYSLHKGLNSETYKLLFDDNFLRYVNDVVNLDLNLTDHWFTRFEVIFLVSLVNLAFLKELEPSELLHSLSIKLVSLLPKSEKVMLKGLLQKCVFNSRCFKEPSSILHGLRGVGLENSKKKSNVYQLLQCAIGSLGKIYDCYESQFDLTTVKEELTVLPSLSSFLELLLPNDWMYIPILKLHSQSQSSNSANEGTINEVTRCLQWILILECLRPAAVRTVNVTARFCRLSTVFLAASDLFLEPTISQLLQASLEELLQYNSAIDFKNSIPGLSSFYDLYTELLEQFAAVSYGNILFGQYILVPLQQKHGTSYRKLLWSEQAAVLRVLSVPIDKVIVPLEEFLEPCETEPSLLNIYLHSLATGAVREKWSPILYMVALHHVATYIRLHEDTILAQHLKEKIEKLGNKELRTRILEYKKSCSQ